MQNDVLDMEAPVGGSYRRSRGGNDASTSPTPAKDRAGADPSQDQHQSTSEVGLGASLPAGGWRPSPEGPPFVVFALPRSRTAWLAQFLSFGPWMCGHEQLRHCRSLDDVRSWLGQPYAGTCETIAAPFWRLLPHLAPHASAVVVRRPVADVVASLMRFGLFDEATLTAAMTRLDAKLCQIEARLPGVLSVAFADLGDEATCGRIFQHCLGEPMPHAWWEAAAPVNVQINLPHMMRQFIAHRPQLEKLAQLARHRIIANMRPTEREFDGVTFKAEPFSVFCRDAAPLIREHCAITGRKPELDFNTGFFQLLDDVGVLQTMIARINGRPFGYLMTIVGPSLEGPEVTEATHTAFYASPAVPGLGMRILRAANDALRERGADRIIMRAGVAGDGPRLGTMYRRVGGERFGEVFKLELEA